MFSLQVDSFILDADDPDPGIEPNFLLSQSVEASNLQTVTVDPETHARLEALLDAAGNYYHDITQHIFCILHVL